MSGDSLRVNGHVVSWADHILKINGVRWFGITGIEYGQKRERSYAHGMSKAHAPIGKTAGKYTPEPLKLTMWARTEIALRRYLMTLAEDSASYGNVSIPIFLQISNGPSDICTVEFVACTIASESASDDESPDANKRTIEFAPDFLVIDGGMLFDNTEA